MRTSEVVFLPSYGDDSGPVIITSKYLKLSSCGVALIPAKYFKYKLS